MKTAHDQTTIGLPAVHLLRGILYREQTDAWDRLLRYRGTLEEYFAVLNLDLYVDESEGYAYLRQHDDPEGDDGADTFPRLMSRRKLSYPLTLLLALLRKRQVEFEAAGSESRLVLSQADIIEMMRLYWDETDTNERKREDRVVLHIKKLESYGFLSQLKLEKDRYEVNRILKAYLPVEELHAILRKLQEYARKRFGTGEDSI